MKTQHTQGNWSIDQKTLYRGEEMIIDENGQYIAGINQRPQSPIEEITANAKLVAAAPGLLKACNFALQGIKHGQIDNITVEVLENAIKKATE